MLVDEGLLIRYPGLGYYVAGTSKPGNPASTPDQPDAPLSPQLRFLQRTRSAASVATHST